MKKSRFLIVSIALILSVLMVASVCIFASSDETAKLTVDASGGKVKVLVNDELKSHGTSTVALKVAVGSKVTLVVEDNTEGFLFWTDNSLNTCADGATTYTFTMTGDTSYTAWFESADGTLVVYRNNNDSKQVLASAEYSSAADFKAHLVDSAIKFGYTFSNWDTPYDEIVAAINAKTPVVEVSPVYTEKVSGYTINVNNGAIQETSSSTGVFAYGDKIHLIAGTAPSGYAFSAWKNSAGKIISTSSTLEVKVFANETFTAVFTEAPVTYPAAAELSITTDKTNKTLLSSAFFFIPEGNVTEYGLIYSKNIKCSEADLILANVDGQGIKKASYKGFTNVLANHFSNVDSVSARSYVIYTDASSVQHTLYSDVVFAEYDDTILKLDIADDGTVSNASVSGIKLNYKDVAVDSTYVTIGKDDAIGKNAIAFTPRAMWNPTDSYAIAVDSSLNEDFKNGFAYEVYFKTNSAPSSYYIGILDYIEAGGFGLNILPGTSNTGTLRAIINTGSEMTIDTPVNFGEWYHVVFTYNGVDTANLYVNGVLVGTKALTASIKLPSFGKNDPHLCIGACTTSGDYDQNGLNGSIAICNIFSTPITDANKVEKMYAKATSADSDTTTNGGTSAPTQSEQEIIDELLNLKHELRVDANGDFKIVVFSDVQCNTPDLNTETLNNIKLIVEREDPDLVLFAGDNSFDIKSEADMRTYITNMVSYIESKKIPWAHVYGNHDDEHAIRDSAILTKEQQQKIYEEFEYCISKDVKYGYNGEEIFGVGNYVLPVLTNDGSKIAFNIWALDSGQSKYFYPSGGDPDDLFITVKGESNGFYGHYEGMEKNQVDWYYETSKLLEKYNGGETIPAMLYQHIPLQESFYAYKLGTNITGTKGENVSAHPRNVGLFAAILERGDVQLIAHGHDHKNDFAADYKGVTFAYTACIGTLEYHDDSMVGGRVVNFSTKTGKVDTNMSYVIERDPGDNILELKINDDNSVTNASTSRPALNSYTGSVGTKSVTTDATINRKFIHFTGGTNDNEPSSYNMLTTSFGEALFEDGFAVESLFRVTAETAKGTYTGIIDYAENGGFALNYKKLDNGQNVVLFEMGQDDTTTGNYAPVLTAPITIGKWHHVLVDFNATTNAITMYLDGVAVASTTAQGGYRGPTVWSGGTDYPGGAYICVGACLTSKCAGCKGFVGDIAIATVHVAPKTELEAVKLYNSVKASSFKNDGTVLKLNIGDTSVTNASATGPALLAYSNTTHSTTIGTNAVLNRKVITFDGGNGAPATYRIYPETLEADFANGFAYEVLFRPTSTAFDGATSYVGILDYDESNGGFGLRGVKTSESKMGLQATFATSNSETIKNISLGDITVGDWCHVVFSFDGTNVNIWVNGVSKYSAAAGGSFRTASFGSTTQAYICVGAAAWGTSKGIYGFIGDIAIATIYSDAVNATKAAELYAATGLK